MSRDYPDWVHPDKAASAGRCFKGELPVASMERLSGLIVEDAGGEVAFKLDFSLTAQRQIRVDVAIHGWLPLQCQRSLKTYRHEFESSAVVGVIADEAEIPSLPGEFEPLACPEQRLKLADLVEEELLLCLPLVPVSPDTERVGEDLPSTAETHRPFEVLASLKKR